jgi:hypothetical protein
MLKVERRIAAIKREEAKGTLDIASDDDRTWFTEYPYRNFRLRAPMKGETFLWAGDLTRASAVIVRRLRPGVRARLLVELHGPRPSNYEAIAERLWRLYEYLVPPMARIADKKWP